MKLSRSYYESLLYDLLKPFVNLYDEAESSIIIPNEIEVSYDTRTMRLESFSRSLLGWSMLPGHEDIKRVIFTMKTESTLNVINIGEKFMIMTKK